jgi:acetyl-CoA acetyltransferase
LPLRPISALQEFQREISLATLCSGGGEAVAVVVELV